MQHNTAVAHGAFDFGGAVVGQIFVTYVFAKRGMIAWHHTCYLLNVYNMFVCYEFYII